MLFWNYKSNYLYEIYSNLIDSDFVIEKKKLFLNHYLLENIFHGKLLLFQSYVLKNIKKIILRKLLNLKK